MLRDSAGCGTMELDAAGCGGMRWDAAGCGGYESYLQVYIIVRYIYIYCDMTAVIVSYERSFKILSCANKLLFLFYSYSYINV